MTVLIPRQNEIAAKRTTGQSQCLPDGAPDIVHPRQRQHPKRARLRNRSGQPRHRGIPDRSLNDRCSIPSGTLLYAQRHGSSPCRLEQPDRRIHPPAVTIRGAERRSGGSWCALYVELIARNRSTVSVRVWIPMGSARSSIVKLGWWCGKALLLPAPMKTKQPGATRR